MTGKNDIAFGILIRQMLAFSALATEIWVVSRSKKPNPAEILGLGDLRQRSVFILNYCQVTLELRGRNNSYCVLVRITGNRRRLFRSRKKYDEELGEVVFRILEYKHCADCGRMAIWEMSKCPRCFSENLINPFEVRFF